MSLGFKRTASGKPKAAGPPVGVVPRSSEFMRIEALPRRVLDPASVPDLTPFFRRPGGTMTLWPIQNAALWEAALYNGMFGCIGIGFGKTIISLLLPEVMNSEKAVLLVPASLRDKTEREIEEVYGKHFILPLDRLTIVAYEELSHPDTWDVLDVIEPDLIIMDEAHRLQNIYGAKKSARAGRWDEYTKAHPATRQCPMSGGMSSRSPRQCAHLSEAALKAGSPYPRGYRELMDWDGVLGVKPEYPMLPGALKRFCQNGEEPRKGFQRRLVETPGVVATTGQKCEIALNLRRLDLKLPVKVEAAIESARKRWCVDDYQFSDALIRASILRQLACGFYYRWAWPGGDPDYEWLEARNNWNRAVHAKLHGAKPGMDTEALLARAAERWLRGERTGKVWDAPEWEPWRAVKDRPEPPKEAIWIDDFLCRDALARAKKAATPCLVWYRYRAVGQRLGELAGLTVYGDVPNGTSADPSGTRHDVCILSIDSHHEGKNLQDHYADNIVTTLPSSGGIVEQMLGRTHRSGQIHPQVDVSWYGHTPEVRAAMASVIADAEYARDKHGQPQRVLYATKVNV